MLPFFWAQFIEDVFVHLTPNQMKPFVKSGCVKSVVLWNPVDLGYAAIYAMRGVVDGSFEAS